MVVVVVMEVNSGWFGLSCTWWGGEDWTRNYIVLFAVSQCGTLLNGCRTKYHMFLLVGDGIHKKE